MLIHLTDRKTDLQKKTSSNHQLSTDKSIKYFDYSLQRLDKVTNIRIDKASNGKGELSNTKSYVQNLVTKYELTGNKEVCIRKILISEREDCMFDIIVRENKIFYRKNKKHNFSTVKRFKSPNGNIEYIFELLKNKSVTNEIDFNKKHLLN